MSRRVPLSYDEAVKLLPAGDYVHVFTNGAPVQHGPLLNRRPSLLGTEMPRAEVLRLLKIGKPELAGNGATALGHGICAWRRVDERDRVLADPIFIKTKEARK
jgi:hypothetical protein